MSDPQSQYALPIGYRLHWFQIESILGVGGFGITYLARDGNLKRSVAIKEFLPSDLSVRREDSSVEPVSENESEVFRWGLDRFLSEARTLARFQHPNIVGVHSVFEANNTAYMVMEYEQGRSLGTVLREPDSCREENLRALLMPLLDGLEQVHEAGFVHRDIKPNNLFVRDDGSPVVLDFGSARQALGVETRTLISLVTPGFAPFEQYNATREGDKQGPWTDIYALGATLYRAVTGKGPVDALTRAGAILKGHKDVLVPATVAAADGYSVNFLRAIDRALAFHPEARPQTIAEWRVMFELETDDGFAALDFPLGEEDQEKTLVINTAGPELPYQKTVRPRRVAAGGCGETPIRRQRRYGRHRPKAGKVPHRAARCPADRRNRDSGRGPLVVPAALTATDPVRGPGSSRRRALRGIGGYGQRPDRHRERLRDGKYRVRRGSAGYRRVARCGRRTYGGRYRRPYLLSVVGVLRTLLENEPHPEARCRNHHAEVRQYFRRR